MTHKWFKYNFLFESADNFDWTAEKFHHGYDDTDEKQLKETESDFLNCCDDMDLDPAIVMKAFRCYRRGNKEFITQCKGYIRLMDVRTIKRLIAWAENN